MPKNGGKKMQVPKLVARPFLKLRALAYTRISWCRECDEN